MSDLSRREFLIGSSATLAATVWSNEAASDPTRRLRHAIIGVGGQGTNHAKTLSKMTDLCEIVAIADVDPERRERAARVLSERAPIQVYEDFRKLLEDPSIDSVTVATPDHWHTPVALHALQARKHVYVEKPCSHNAREALLLAEAAKKTGKCVQHGTQGRSGKGFIDGVKFLREGGIGKVRLAKAINHQFREPIGREPDSDPPPGVNYDLWLGPAPKRPFSKNRWHYNWHWWWDTGTGDIGNDGVHQVDQARWGLGVGLPKAVSASGGQLFYDDDHETPDTQIVTYEYDDCYLVYEMRLWTDYPLEGHDNGVIFYGDGGIVEFGRKGCIVTRIGKEPEPLGGGSDFTENIRNFLVCARDNNPAGLNAPISEGALSTILSHLGNIGVRAGRRLRLDPETCRILDDPEADAMLGRTYREGYELPVV